MEPSIPKLDFRFVRNGLIRIQSLNGIVKNNIMVFYKYDVSDKINPKSNVNDWKQTYLGKTFRISSNQFSYHQLRQIDLSNTRNLGRSHNDKSSSVTTMYLHLRYRTQEGVQYGELSSTIVIPLDFERVLTVSMSKHGQIMENTEYSCCRIHPLIRKNIAMILEYYIQNFINSNYSLQEIQALIMCYFPAKDGALYINKDQMVTLYSDYQYEFDFINIEYGGKLTVQTYNPETKIGGRLLITSLGDCIVNGCIDLNGCGYKSYYTDSKTGSMKDKIFKGLGYGSNCGQRGGNAAYATRGSFTCNRNRGCRRSRKHDMGDVYGDDELSILYLGSAGGRARLAGWRSVKRTAGGHPGGGALLLKCYGILEIMKGCIIANSKDDVFNSRGGGYGSGGSIKIVCKRFVFDPLYHQWNWKTALRIRYKPKWRNRYYWMHRGIYVPSDFYISEYYGKCWYKERSVLNLESVVSVIGRGRDRIGCGRICIRIGDNCYGGNDILDGNSCLRLKFYIDDNGNQKVEDKGFDFDDNYRNRYPEEFEDSD